MRETSTSLPLKGTAMIVNTNTNEIEPIKFERQSIESLELIADTCFDFLRFEGALSPSERYVLSVLHFKAITELTK